MAEKPLKSFYIPIIGISFLPRSSMDRVKQNRPDLIAADGPYRAVELLKNRLYVAWLRRRG